jgi:hypothetical protein
MVRVRKQDNLVVTMAKSLTNGLVVLPNRVGQGRKALAIRRNGR